MLERERLESKKISKTNAVTSQIPYAMDADNVHVGPSDYVPWLLDRKWCHIRMEGTTFGDVPLTLEAKLEVWDSPNSAGVVIDAVRCAKLGLDHGLKGALLAPSAYFKKSPPQQFPDDQAREMVEDYIRTYGHKKGKTPVATGPVQVRVRMQAATGSASRQTGPSTNGRVSANGRPGKARATKGKKTKRALTKSRS